MTIRPRFSSRRWPGWGVLASFDWLPVVLLMVVMLLGQAAPYAPWKSSVQIAVAMGSVFFLARNRPAAMPPLAAFLVGLLHDLFGAMPVGVGVLGLLLAQGAAQVLAEKRRAVAMGQSWIKGWIVFAPVMAIVSATIWVIMSMISGQILPFAAPLREGLVVIALYPAVVLGWFGLQRLIDRPDYAS